MEATATRGLGQLHWQVRSGLWQAVWECRTEREGRNMPNANERGVVLVNCVRSQIPYQGLAGYARVAVAARWWWWGRARGRARTVRGSGAGTG